MNLTPEERQRIYEEEKMRFDAQNTLRKEASEEKSKKAGIGCLSIIIIIVIAVVFFSDDNETPAAPPVEVISESKDSLASPPVAPAEPEAPKSEWDYSSEIDSVSGKELKSASTVSINQHELDFPYNGGSKGIITIRKHPRHGEDVIFGVTKGQLLCDVSSGCTAAVRFDDKPAMQVHASGPADYSSTALFLSGYDRLVKEIKASKKMIVEVKFFQEGAKIYEFDIEGLEWD